MTEPILPTFDHIVFNADDHAYVTTEGQPLRNATAIVKSLQKPFDAEYHAERKAAQRSVPKEVVLTEWQLAREAGQRRGNQLHAHIAARLTEQEPPAGEPLPEMLAFDKWWDATRSSDAPLQLLRNEWVIGDPTLGIAGMLDTLFLDSQGQLVLYDWKSGKRFDTYNRYAVLGAPFSDLSDCELINYSLQLSIYRLILRRAGLTSIAGASIVHFGAMGTYQIYPALDFTDRLEAWFTSQRQTPEA